MLFSLWMRSYTKAFRFDKRLKWMLMLSNVLLILSGKLEMPKTQIPVYTRTPTQAMIHLLLYELRQTCIVKGRLKAKPCSSPYNKKGGGLEGCVRLGGGGLLQTIDSSEISPHQNVQPAADLATIDQRWLKQDLTAAISYWDAHVPPSPGI